MKTHLARELRGEMVMRVEGGGDVEARRVVILHGRDGRLEDMAGFPKLGAFVHVLVKPLVPNRQMELLDEKGQLGMKRSKKGKSPLKELD